MLALINNEQRTVLLCQRLDPGLSTGFFLEEIPRDRANNMSLLPIPSCPTTFQDRVHLPDYFLAINFRSMHSLASSDVASFFSSWLFDERISKEH